MTEIQRCIVLVSVMGTILSKYEDHEITPAIQDMLDVCEHFMNKQSGIEKIGLKYKIVNRKKYDQFTSCIKTGGDIWQKTVDQYAKKSITIDAISMISALYDFAPAMFNKHTRISKARIDAYMAGGFSADESIKLNGVVLGGYITELLAQEMGQKVNGRLRALKNKVAREVAA